MTFEERVANYYKTPTRKRRDDTGLTPKQRRRTAKKYLLSLKRMELIGETPSS